MLLHDDVLSSALVYIRDAASTLCTKLLVVQSASSTALCSAVTISSNNFGAITSSASPAGMKTVFATHASTPLTAVAITASGSADKIALLTAASQVQVEADITSAPKAVSSGDTVSVGSFEIIIQDAA